MSAGWWASTSLLSLALTHSRTAPFFHIHTRRIGSSSLRSATAAKTNAVLLDLLYIAELPAGVSPGPSYASTLSALLTVPLTLPVLLPDPDSDSEPPTAFSEQEIREWDHANAELRAKLERGMVESAELWLDVLEHVPPLLPGSGSDSDTLVRRRIEYLEAVRTELDLVAVRNPTLQVYSAAAAAVDDEDERWRALELEEREREERQQRRMEDKFERWLDEIFSVAEAAKVPVPDRVATDSDDRDDGNKEEEEMTRRRRRRDMLDVPLAGSGRPGPTWRDQLRVQWRTMFDPDAGGVLGQVEREMDNVAAKFGLEEEEDADAEDDDDDDLEEPQQLRDWTPDPLPLMAAHHLRAQLASTVADLRSGARGGGGPLAAPPHQEWERATLPPSLDASSWPDEYLSLEQLAIRVDRRARKWALRIFGVVTRRASSSSEERTTRPLSIRERVNLLRGASKSPFPSFMRTVDATFKAPRDPAHFRIGISQHDLANAIFALAPAEDPSRPAMAPRGLMARGQGQGGCSALQREKWRRETGAEGRQEVERRLLLRARREREGEAGMVSHSGEAARDEL